MKIIASWDDGAAWDLKVAELMKKYSIPTIFYWPVGLEKSKNMSRVTKFLYMKECKELAKEFEIGSHTVTHEFLTRIPPNDAEYEITESRKQWQDLTGQEIASFCYPRGYYNTAIKEMVKLAGYKTARTTLVGSLSSPKDPLESPTTLHVGVDRNEYGGKTWEEYGRMMIEQAKPDSIFHMMGHSWEIEREKDWQPLEEFLTLLRNT